MTITRELIHLESEPGFPTELIRLPRPSKSKYPGSFPLHAERIILSRIGYDPEHHPEQNKLILHPFGGKAEYGIRCDLRLEVQPDFICDAHDLSPIFKDGTFEVVFLDPPYDDDYADRLYKTPELHPSKYVPEAVRVLKPGGVLIFYHDRSQGQPEGTKQFHEMGIVNRSGQHIRWVGFFRKGEVPFKATQSLSENYS